MFRHADCAILLLTLLFLLSCRQPENMEKEETAYWNSRFIDSSFRLLYRDKDTTRALRYFDSQLLQSDPSAVYPRSSRFGIRANYHYFFTGNNAATAAQIDSALALFHTTELQNRYPRTYVGFLIFGGNIAYRLSQYSKANDYYFKAKTVGDAYLDPCERAPFSYNIAMVLYRQENFFQSMRYFQDAFALQQTCSPQTTAVVLQQQEIQSNIGLCHIQLKSFDSALIYFDNALRLADHYRDSLGPAVMDKIYGVVYGNKAQVAMAKGQLQEAEQLALQSIALNDREGYEVENALGVKLQLAGVYARRKNLASMYNILRSLDHTIQEAPPKLQWEWRRLMAAYYEQTANTDSALHYTKMYHRLQDSIAKEQKELAVADVVRQLRDKEQEGQIALLKKDQHITKIILWVTILISCMAMLIIYLIYYNYRRNKKSLAQSLALNEEIRLQKEAREKEARQQHQQITEAVIRAQEAERSLIGLELHDNVGQVLTTVKLHNEMLLEGIGDPKAILPRSLRHLQNCIDEIRSLSRRLSAPTLGKISLEDSINDLIESINLTSKVRITRQISGLENKRLRQDLHLGIYRILQEQLNNVLKHADASAVVIRLEQKENNLRLCISDNGKGFAVHQSKSGIGLMNMQTRAENLGGTFTVASQPGQGCQVEVVVPCLQ